MSATLAPKPRSPYWRVRDVRGDNNGRFASQSSDSTQVSLSMQVSRAISLSYGVLVLQMDMAMTRELNAEGSSIDASLFSAPNNTWKTP